jgi:hypothetical protein
MTRSPGGGHRPSEQGLVREAMRELLPLFEESGESEPHRMWRSRRDVQVDPLKSASTVAHAGCQHQQQGIFFFAKATFWLTMAEHRP